MKEAVHHQHGHERQQSERADPLRPPPLAPHDHEYFVKRLLGVKRSFVLAGRVQMASPTKTSSRATLREARARVRPIDATDRCFTTMLQHERQRYGRRHQRRNRSFWSRSWG